MRKVYLGLVIHNHQPVGNFDWVFEDAYRQAYLPLVQSLEKHPQVRLSLHYSGPLIDWLLDHHPDFFQRLAALARKGQVEVMTGGYYEPILPIIPEVDRLGQIAKMTEFVRARFGDGPTGLWLAERVWEPHLPKPLAEAGVEWTVVDDSHFKAVGFGDGDIFGYYITEEEDRRVKVFSSSKILRYLIPWRDVEEVIEYLASMATEDGTRIAVMGDDGEKFGVWPGTHDHCWVKGWMERFFQALEENSQWLITIPPGEYARRFRALGLVYLPDASYTEMMEWALPADKSWEYGQLRHRLEEEGKRDILQYMRGGFWRNFLAKYPEANNLHKKMMLVSRKVHRAEAIDPLSCGRDELWKGQCNCPYWHGVFGGLYLNHIRTANYHNLILAENKADSILHKGGSWLEEETTDFDADGNEEVLVDGDAFSAYFDPSEGGSLFEWDIRRYGLNAVATLSRRPEAYHQALASLDPAEAQEGIQTIHAGIRFKDPNLSSQLLYDRYRRSAAIDHLLPVDATLETFAAGDYSELDEFPTAPYEWNLERKENHIVLEFSRSGWLHDGVEPMPVKLVKRFRIWRGEERLEVRYRLTNMGDRQVTALFGSEWNLNILGGYGDGYLYYLAPGRGSERSPLNSVGELESINEMQIGNEGLGLEMVLRLGKKARVWVAPIETISNSEGGLEKVYQGTCIMPVVECSLRPGEAWALDLEWQVR